jgi:hypothetical protein
MRKTLLAFAAAVSLATIASVAMPTKADAQVFVYEGARYCFYFDGWHGPGWYRCGYRLRTGLGWGGVYGWHGWRHAGWERRHGRMSGDVNVRIRSGERQGLTTRSRTTIHNGARENFRGTANVRTRENTTVRGGTNVRGNTNVRSGANVQGSTHMRSTTGQGGPSMKGGAQMKAGPGGAAAGSKASGGAAGVDRQKP